MGERRAIEHVDGTLIFQSALDRKNEEEVAALLGKAWNCQVNSFGALSPIDWLAIRNGRPTAVLELKSRTHASDKYPTVYLNVRKWLALSLASIGMGIPALFVVKFIDAVMWISIAEVDARITRMAGWPTTEKAKNDIEPIIQVYVDQMKELR